MRTGCWLLFGPLSFVACAAFGTSPSGLSTGSDAGGGVREGGGVELDGAKAGTFCERTKAITSDLVFCADFDGEGSRSPPLFGFRNVENASLIRTVASPLGPLEGNGLEVELTQAQGAQSTIVSVPLIEDGAPYPPTEIVVELDFSIIEMKRQFVLAASVEVLGANCAVRSGLGLGSAGADEVRAVRFQEESSNESEDVGSLNVATPYHATLTVKPQREAPGSMRLSVAGIKNEATAAYPSGCSNVALLIGARFTSVDPSPTRLRYDNIVVRMR